MKWTNTTTRDRSFQSPAVDAAVDAAVNLDAVAVAVVVLRDFHSRANGSEVPDSRNDYDGKIGLVTSVDHRRQRHRCWR